jgi:hypothetical protein
MTNTLNRVGKAVRGLALIGLATALAGCGGGGGGGGGDSGIPGGSGPSAEGVYGGTLTGSTSSAFQMLVLENGEYWALYGTSTPSTFFVAGFVQGSGTSNNGTFTSSNAKDFGFAPAVSGSVSATYTATPTITGTVSSNQGNVGFSGGAIAGSLYDYDAAARLSTVAGSWTLTELTGEGVAMTIAANGSFTAVSTEGCNFSGTVAPRASGKNVFNVSLTFGAAPCSLPGTAASGIAVAYPLANGQTQLLVAVTEGTRTYGTAAFGTR